MFEFAMILETQPVDFERLAVILMVRLRSAATSAAWLTLEPAISDRIADCRSSRIFIWINLAMLSRVSGFRYFALRSPISLLRVGRILLTLRYAIHLHVVLCAFLTFT